MPGIAVPERPAMWLGHYSLQLLWLAVAVTVADDATGQTSSVLEWAGVAAFTLWIVASMADGGVHRERLCERCVAATPLDPQASVGRWRRALRLHHSRKATGVMCGAVLAVSIAADSFRHKPAWALAASALVWVALGALNVIPLQHRRLYPWCPFCHWGDGGEGEVSPDVPAPAMSR